MNSHRPRVSRTRIALAATILALALAASAFAELAQKGNLFVRFDGGISPRALPRSSPAPIGVRIEGTIRSLGGQHPPALRAIKVAVSREGHLDAAGLPVCRPTRIAQATSSQALAACGPALVGGGGYTAKTSLADQQNVVFSGEILLFNSVLEGRPAILSHVYQANPAPVTRVFTFRIRRTAGTFGTVIAARVPASLNRNGYLKSIYLQIQRRYVSAGRSKSYLSAACPAPAGFSAAVFPFAKVSMSFADGRTLASTMTRSCKVRR